MVESRCTFGTWLIELDCLFPCEKLDDPLDEKLIVEPTYVAPYLSNNLVSLTELQVW